MAIVTKNRDGSATVHLSRQETVKALKRKRHAQEAWDDMPPGMYAAEHGR